MNILNVEKVSKTYGEKELFNNISLGINSGDKIGLIGVNGTGKSTLLNCIGGLDTMDSGSVKVAGTEIFGMKKEDLLEYRRANLGFIFQFYNLVPNLTVRENIQVCEFLTDNPLSVDELLDTLGLTEHQNKFPFFRWTAAALRNCKGISEKSKVVIV